MINDEEKKRLSKENRGIGWSIVDRLSIARNYLKKKKKKRISLVQGRPIDRISKNTQHCEENVARNRRKDGKRTAWGCASIDGYEQLGPFPER